MRQPWEVISLLEADNSRLAKESIILEEAKAGNATFFNGCRLALDAMITFGIKQVKEKTDEDGPGLSWSNFDNVVNLFRTRKLTGNSARDAIDELINQATKTEWNDWYRRILIKDMRAGFSEKTINNVVKKVYADYSIPVFTCQLAHDSANHESKVCGKKLIEVKLDGVRVITIVHPDGHVDLFSRNGKELANFPHIQEQISKVAKKAPPPYACVIDGEIMSSSFQDLMTQVHRKSDVKANDAILNLFDFIPLADFEKGVYDTPQDVRSLMLSKWVELHQADLPEVRAVGQELVDLDTEEGQKRYTEINAQAVAGGYEGIMIKNPEAGYECKRSVAWLKLKPFIEVSLSVLAVEEGTGRNEGRLGALVCSGNDDGKDIVVNVGSGFTDSNRDTYWASRDELLGNIVEVRADAVTQNQDGTYSLRFPRFKGFRGFEPGEKI